MKVKIICIILTLAFLLTSCSLPGNMPSNEAAIKLIKESMAANKLNEPTLNLKKGSFNESGFYEIGYETILLNWSPEAITLGMNKLQEEGYIKDYHTYKFKSDKVYTLHYYNLTEKGKKYVGKSWIGGEEILLREVKDIKIKEMYKADKNTDDVICEYTVEYSFTPFGEVFLSGKDSEKFKKEEKSRRIKHTNSSRKWE